jgi:hypothetical protein
VACGPGKRELVWQLAKARARDLTKLLGVEVTVRGVEHLGQGGPFIYTPNHQSHLDILALLGVLPGRTRFAAKKELWRHPKAHAAREPAPASSVTTRAGSVSPAAGATKSGRKALPGPSSSPGSSPRPPTV